MSEILTQKDFYEAMKSYLVANQDRVTDFNKGSTLDTQLNAIATQLNQAMVKASGGFKVQFEQIPYQVFDFNRKTPNTASGTVIFSRQTPDAVQITIPIGTLVGTVSGLLYATQAEAIILSGNLNSSVVSIIANDIGTAYNAVIGDVNQINSSVPGINSVTNNTAVAGGTDKENNSSYFTRFTNFILGLAGSNRFGILTAATSVETIQSGYVEDHFPPESGLYNYTIYVDDGSGSVPQLKLDEIELVIYGNDTSIYKGYNAAGINFRVLSAGLISIAVAYTVEVDVVSYDLDATETQIQETILGYVNSLWVGAEVIRAEIIKLIQGLDAVLNTTVLTLNGGVIDIAVLPAQVARISTIVGTLS